MNGVDFGAVARKVPKGRLKVAQDVVLGNDEQAGKSREGRLNNGAKFSAVPSGLDPRVLPYTRRFCMVRITFPVVTAVLYAPETTVPPGA
jgi:hypothetical protein